jgi:hypothetical protein
LSKPAKQEKGLIIIIIIVLAIGLFYFKGNIFGSVIPIPQQTVSMVQWNGLLGNNIQDEGNPYGYDISSTALIGRYKIVQSKSERPDSTVYSGGSPNYACKVNDCGGTASGVLTAPNGLSCSIYTNSNYATTNTCPIRGTGCTTSAYQTACNNGIASNYRSLCECHQGVLSNYGDRWCPDNKVTYSSVTCGGYVATNIVENNNPGCWWKADVYDGSAIVKTFDWQKTSQSFDIGTLHMQLDADSRYLSDYVYCMRIVNSYYFTVPSSLFSFDAVAPTNAVEGDTIIVLLTINNSYQPVKINLATDFEIDTSLENPSTQHKSSFLDLPLGSNTFTFTIPSVQATSMKYKYAMSVLMMGSQFSGVNGQCYGESTAQNKPLSACSYVEIGKASSEWQTVKIQSLAAVVVELQGTLAEKIQYIKELNASIYQEAKLVNDLNLTLQQQVQTLKDLNIKVAEAGVYIATLQKDIQGQADFIKALTNNVTEQGQIISQLSTNLATKIALVDALNVENARQKDLVIAMKESFSNQGVIIDSLNLTIVDDARLISQLTTDNKAMAEIISGMQLNIDDMTNVIKNLNLNLDQEATLIANLKTTNEEKEAIITKISSSLDEQQKLISLYKEKMNETPAANSFGLTTTQIYWIAGIIIALIIIGLLKKK